MTKLMTFDSNSKIYPSVSLVLVEAQRDQIRNAQNAAANTRRPAGKFHNCALPVISCAVDQTIGISKRKENQTPKASPRKKKNFYENGRYRKWREKASDGYITRALILIHSDNFHTLFDFFENKKNIFFFFLSDANSTPAPTIVDDDSFEKELCKSKEAGEWFRLQAGEGDNCRDVIQCTSSVSLRTSSVLHISYL